jgi:NAD(P)-dependent dehydrogenase (short-subunit alcohol dehydrogenase family)
MSSKVVLITGCSTGVGLAATVLFAKDGYKVYATMRNLSKDGELRAAVAAAGVESKVEVIELDVVSDDSVNNAVEKILTAEGRIDVLVNNAGFSKFGGVEMVSLDGVKDQFETNFYGCIRTMKAVLPGMRKQRSGHVINVTSIGGVWGQPLNDIYCASKFALEGLTESMSAVYREFGVRCCLVEPGAIKTAFIQNAQIPDLTGVADDLKPVVARVIQFYTESAKQSSAQTSEEVAVHLVAVANNPNAPLRTQTNPAIDNLFKTQLADTTGQAGAELAHNLFFSEGWVSRLPQA